MASELTKRSCQACSGQTAPLAGEELKSYHQELDNDWELVGDHHLHKCYKFPDFQQALDFTNRVGRVAEEEGHHPDIQLSYGQVIVEVFTHKVDGLTESDFILAAKADQELS